MIELSSQQVRKYAVPLIYECMGEDVGKRAEYQWQETEGENTDLFGFFDEDRLICIAGLGSEISKRKLWLGYLAVAWEYRRKGYGRRALRFVEGIARSRGYRWMFVETYDHPIFTAACKLYEAEGYRAEGELPEYLDDGSDALFYRKNLVKR